MINGKNVLSAHRRNTALPLETANLKKHLSICSKGFSVPCNVAVAMFAEKWTLLRWSLEVKSL